MLLGATGLLNGLPDGCAVGAIPSYVPPQPARWRPVRLWFFRIVRRSGLPCRCGGGRGRILRIGRTPDTRHRPIQPETPMGRGCRHGPQATARRLVETRQVAANVVDLVPAHTREPADVAAPAGETRPHVVHVHRTPGRQRRPRGFPVVVHGGTSRPRGGVGRRMRIPADRHPLPRSTRLARRPTPRSLLLVPIRCPRQCASIHATWDAPATRIIQHCQRETSPLLRCNRRATRGPKKRTVPKTLFCNIFGFSFESMPGLVAGQEDANKVVSLPAVLREKHKPESKTSVN